MNSHHRQRLLIGSLYCCISLLSLSPPMTAAAAHSYLRAAQENLTLANATLSELEADLSEIETEISALQNTDDAALDDAVFEAKMEREEDLIEEEITVAADIEELEGENGVVEDMDEILEGDIKAILEDDDTAVGSASLERGEDDYEEDFSDDLMGGLDGDGLEEELLEVKNEIKDLNSEDDDGADAQEKEDLLEELQEIEQDIEQIIEEKGESGDDDEDGYQIYSPNDVKQANITSAGLNSVTLGGPDSLPNIDPLLTMDLTQYNTPPGLAGSSETKESVSGISNMENEVDRHDINSTMHDGKIAAGMIAAIEEEDDDGDDFIPPSKTEERPTLGMGVNDDSLSPSKIDEMMNQKPSEGIDDEITEVMNQQPSKGMGVDDDDDLTPGKIAERTNTTLPEMKDESIGHGYSEGDPCKDDEAFVSNKGITCATFVSLMASGSADQVRCAAPVGLHDEEYNMLTYADFCPLTCGKCEEDDDFIPPSKTEEKPSLGMGMDDDSLPPSKMANMMNSTVSGIKNESDNLAGSESGLNNTDELPNETAVPSDVLKNDESLGHGYSEGDPCKDDETFVSKKGITCATFVSLMASGSADEVRCAAPVGLHDAEYNMLTYADFCPLTCGKCEEDDGADLINESAKESNVKEDDDRVANKEESLNLEGMPHMSLANATNQDSEELEPNQDEVSSTPSETPENTTTLTGLDANAYTDDEDAEINATMSEPINSEESSNTPPTTTSFYENEEKSDNNETITNVKEESSESKATTSSPPLTTTATTTTQIIVKETLSPSPEPTYRPTEEAYVQPIDDELDPVMSEQSIIDNEAFSNGESSTHSGGRDIDDFLREEEEEVKKVGGWMGLAAIILAVWTAYQMSENPDGICASICRLAITVLGCVIKMLLLPFKYISGGGRSGAGSYMATPSYRDPYGASHMELT